MELVMQENKTKITDGKKYFSVMNHLA